jgi:hypothetical protein
MQSLPFNLGTNYETDFFTATVTQKTLKLKYNNHVEELNFLVYTYHLLMTRGSCLAMYYNNVKNF